MQNMRKSAKQHNFASSEQEPGRFDWSPGAFCYVFLNWSPDVTTQLIIDSIWPFYSLDFVYFDIFQLIYGHQCNTKRFGPNLSSKT